MNIKYHIPTLQSLNHEKFYFTVTTQTGQNGDGVEGDPFSLTGSDVLPNNDDCSNPTLDIWALTNVLSGSTFVVTISPTSGLAQGTLNLILAVLDANENVISTCNCINENGAAADASGLETCSFTAPNSGIYQIQVFNQYLSSSSGPGPYSLSIAGTQIGTPPSMESFPAIDDEGCAIAYSCPADIL